MPALLSFALLAAAARAEPPRFDAIRFFMGSTEGHARLKVITRRSRAVHVRGHGRVDRDGALVLDQIVAQEGKPPTNRRWRIRQTAPGRYAGTLTDAAGPIAGETIGARLHLRYRAKHGIAVEQWLTLAPDGRSARNRLTAKKLGITVASLDETIRKTD